MGRKNNIVAKAKQTVSETKKKKQFAKLYQKYVDHIYRYIYARLLNRENAEDTTAQTFTTAYEKYLIMDKKLENPKAWFIQIARNHMGNIFQKKKFKKVDIDKVDVKDSGKSTDEIVISRELSSNLKKYFKKLPSLYREILSLRVWEEYKFAEIGEILNISENAAKKRYYRAIAALKELTKDKKELQFPILIAGLGSMAQDSMFLPSKSFITSTIAAINPNVAKIFFNLIGEKVISIFGKYFTTKQIVAAGVSTVVGTSAVVGTGVYINNQVQTNKIEKEKAATEEQVEPEEETVATETQTETSCLDAEGFSDLNIELPENWQCRQSDSRLELESDLFLVQITPFTEGKNQETAEEEEKEIKTGEVAPEERADSESEEIISETIYESLFIFIQLDLEKQEIEKSEDEDDAVKTKEEIMGSIYGDEAKTQNRYKIEVFIKNDKNWASLLEEEQKILFDLFDNISIKNQVEGVTEETLTYENPVFPDFSIPYDESWDLTANEYNSQETDKNLKSYDIILEKGGVKLTFELNPIIIDESLDSESFCSNTTNYTHIIDNIYRIETETGYKYMVGEENTSISRGENDPTAINSYKNLSENESYNFCGYQNGLTVQSNIPNENASQEDNNIIYSLYSLNISVTGQNINLEEVYLIIKNMSLRKNDE